MTHMIPVQVYNATIGHSIRMMSDRRVMPAPDELIETSTTVAHVIRADPRLSPLLDVEMLTIRQIVTCCNMNRRYHFKILKEDESIVYSADVHYFDRRSKRMFFEANFFDENHAIAFRSKKSINKMTVSIGSSEIGTITCRSFCLYPKFTIEDSEGKTIFRITGPFNTCSMFKNVEYPILSADNVYRIGSISKLWDGCCLTEMCRPPTDKFEIHFPRDLSAHMKAVIICLAILLDVSFFE